LVEVASTDACAANAPPSKRTGGLWGRLPKELVTSPNLSPEATFLLAHRSLHVDGKKGWGCNHRAMAATVRSGFSLGVFKRTLKEVKDSGHLDRKQGKRNRPGRGRGYAVDRLAFARPKANFVKVDRELFNGTLTPAEIATALYLRARGNRLATPWQLMKRFGVTRSTASTIMRGWVPKTPGGKRLPQIGLLQSGHAKNYGRPDAPLWGIPALENPTLKKTTLRKTTLQRTTRTRKTYPSHQISPTRNALDKHEGAAPAFESEELRRTDCDGETLEAIQRPAQRGESAKELPGRSPWFGEVIQTAMKAQPESISASAKGPMVMDRLRDPVRLSPKQRAAIARCNGDEEDLYDRAMVARERLEARGKAMGNVARYMVAMAQEDFRRENGTEIGVVKDLVSGNRFQQDAARKSLTESWGVMLEGASKGRPLQTGRTPNGAALMAGLKVSYPAAGQEGPPPAPVLAKPTPPAPLPKPAPASEALQMLLDADPKTILAETLRGDVDGLGRFLAGVSDAEVALQVMVEHLKSAAVLGRPRCITTWEAFRPQIKEWLLYLATKAKTKSGG
jgi:hypothetical protein